MVDGPGPLPDSNLEVLAYLSIVAVVVGVFTVFSGLDSQVEFAATAPIDYLSNPADAELRFTQDQIQLLNEVSSRSLGSDAVAGERLYCYSVRNGNVRNLRLADFIEENTETSVSGSCVTQFPGEDIDGFLHTHPEGSDQLSEEDKNLESDIRYTCIQYREIAVSPSGSVFGLNCWKVTPGNTFEPVGIAVR